jgi:hypothetical protein
LADSAGDVDTAATDVSKFVGGIPGKLPSLPTVESWGKGVGSAFAGGLSSYDYATPISAFGSGIFNGLDTSVGWKSPLYTTYAAAWGKTIGTEIGNGLASYDINSKVGAFGGNVHSVLDTYVGPTSQITTDMPIWGRNIGGALGGGLINYDSAPAVEDMRQDIWGNLQQKVGGTSALYTTTMPTWGKDVTGSWVGGLYAYKMADNLAALAEQARTVFDGVLGPSSPVTKQSMPAYGGSVANAWLTGIAAGINTGSGNTSITTAITALVERMVAATTTALQAHSPSRVMAVVGNYIPLGLAEGITAGIPDVQTAAAALAGAVEPSLSELFGANTAVSTERRIIVAFEGQAGGGVPLTPDQFYQLKRDLSYSIRMGG